MYRLRAGSDSPLSPPDAFPSVAAAPRNRFFLLWLVPLAVSVMGISHLAHQAAGWTLPVPWNDESWYLWSAISLSEGKGFFSESLNPERVVPMSPVFQVPLAMLFRFTGFSFSLARRVSWGYMMLAYVGLLFMTRGRPFPFFSACVVSLFFLGGTAVVAGNMVRPEAMVWALVVWGFLASDSGMPWIGLSLAGIAALVHPVGAVFFGAALLVFGLQCRAAGRWVGPTGVDWMVMVCAGIVLALHLGFLMRHWTVYWSDVGAAAGERVSSGSILLRVFASNKSLWFWAYLFLLALSTWKKPSHGIAPCALGLAALLVMMIRTQMWYEIFNQMSFLIITLMLTWAAARIGSKTCLLLTRFRGRRIAAAGSFVSYGLVLFLMLRFNYAHGFVTGPRNYPDKLEWGWGMRVDAAPYLTEADIAAVVKHLQAISEGTGYRRVRFLPDGDALFFVGRLPPGMIPYQGARTDIREDLAVVRKSRHAPAWLTRSVVLDYLARHGAKDLLPFYERSETEQWFLVTALGEPSLAQGGCR